MELLNGERLNEQQIKIIKEASDRQIKLALWMNASNVLSGQKYTNYCHNISKLNRK